MRIYHRYKESFFLSMVYIYSIYSIYYTRLHIKTRIILSEFRDYNTIVK